MIHGEIRMNSAVRPPRPSKTSQNRLEATRHARLRSPFSSRSEKTGTNADESAASATKTFTRRLRAAVSDGDRDRISAEHSELVRQIDKAVAKGALHRNTAARKKAQAAKLVSGS